MKATFETLTAKWNATAKAHGIDIKSAEWIRFMQQAAAAINRQ
jgi:hypothetical protein